MADASRGAMNEDALAIAQPAVVEIPCQAVTAARGTAAARM
jgi:hypothetical protein